MTAGPRRRPHRTIGAALLAVLMLVCALSLWTAIPLAWLWIGSQVAATQFPSLGPYAVVFFGVLFSILLVAWLLGLMNELYLKLTGTHSVEPIRLGWLRSMRDSQIRQAPTLLETVIVGSVLIAAIALTVWFFLYAGSPLQD
jgi:hypothetical protein